MTGPQRIPAWVERILVVASQLAPEDFYGKVEINFQAGGVTFANVTQSFRQTNTQVARDSST